MSNPSSGNPFSNQAKEIVEMLQETFQQSDIPYFLIGALARDVHFNRHGIIPVRRTEDIDFAVLIPDMGRFLQLKEALEKKGFAGMDTQYRLLYKNTVIDILPIGDVETNHTVYFDRPKAHVSVFGLKEIVQDETNITSINHWNLPVVSVESLFILKLIAFYDNWPERYKDLDDVWELLRNYWEMVEDEVFEKHHDLLTSEDFEEVRVAARVLGRKMSPILEKSSQLRDKVLEIFEHEVSENPGPVTSNLARKLRSKALEDAQGYLLQILTGIREKQK